MKENKISLGDSAKLITKIDDGSIDLILTDPPYGVGFKSDFYDDSKDYVFSMIGEWYKEWYRVLKKGSHIFVFVPTLEIHQWINEGIKTGFEFKNIITTEVYGSGGVSRAKNGFDFRAQPILHFTKGKGKELNEYDLFKTSEAWLKDKRNENPKEFTYVYPNIISKEILFANTKSGKREGRHPNEKNVQLLKFLIGVSTKEGDKVLDPFMGSGSTIKACIELGRSFEGMEQNEGWFESVNNVLKQSFVDFELGGEEYDKNN